MIDLEIGAHDCKSDAPFTRIYSATQDKEVRVTLRFNGDLPTLHHVWVGTGRSSLCASYQTSYRKTLWMERQLCSGEFGDFLVFIASFFVVHALSIFTECSGVPSDI